MKDEAYVAPTAVLAVFGNNYGVLHPSVKPYAHTLAKSLL
jgi:hypothetical protein